MVITGIFALLVIYNYVARSKTVVKEANND